MTLRSRLTALAAPILVAVAYDTLILGARVLGLYKTIHENAAMFNGGEALENLERAIQDFIDDEDRRAA